MAVAEQLRLFVAIELPPGVRVALAGLQRELQPRCSPGVRWVDAEGIHLTLKFLGGVEGARVPPVQAAVEQAASGQAAFRLSLGSTGFFPHPRRPRVFWVGIEGEVERLGALARRVEAALSPLGFPPEGRPFTAHLTLARLGERMASPHLEAFGRLAQAAPWQPGHPFTVDGVSLMRSQLTPQGAIYTCLHRVGLAPSPTGE